VHWYRNIFSHVPSTKVREIAAMLKAIHAGEDLAAAREKAIRVIEKLRGLRLSCAAELVEAAVVETLSYYAFPEEHWRRIRTNNPLERILREIRRRTRVVGAFPDGQSALNLAAARLRHIAGTAWSTKRYLNIELLKDQQMRGCHHRVSQGRVPLSQPKLRKILDTTSSRGFSPVRSVVRTRP
jgi:transposase-like protein